MKHIAVVSAVFLVWAALMPSESLTTPGTLAETAGLRVDFTVLPDLFVVAMPAPSGQEVYRYEAVVAPVLGVDPILARPLGAGAVAENGDSVALQVSLPRFSGPVDVYLALHAPAVLRDDLLILDASGAFRRFSEVGLVPWREAILGPITESPIGAVSTAFLPQGVYDLFLAVTPADDHFSRFYLWATSFSILRHRFPGIQAVSTDFPGLYLASFLPTTSISLAIDPSMFLPPRPDHVVFMANGRDGGIDVIDGTTGGFHGSLTWWSQRDDVISLDPTGRHLFSAGSDQYGAALDVFDMETCEAQRLEKSLYDTVRYGAMCMSPDGSRLGVTSYSTNYHCFFDVWDILTRRRLFYVDQNGNWGGGREYCPADCAFSPDGSRIYVTGGLYDNLLVFDAVTFAEVARAPLGRTAAEIAVSPDGSRLYITAGPEHAVSVVDAASLQVVRVPDTVGLHPENLAVSPDGTELWIQSYLSNMILVKDARTFEQKTMLVFGPGHSGWPPVGDVTQILFAAEGGRVFSVSYNSLSIIDAGTLKFIESRSVSNRSHALAAGPYWDTDPEPPAALRLDSGGERN